MDERNKISRARTIWRNGYTFALFSLFALGVALIVIGAMLQTEKPTTLSTVLIGIGITLGPAAVVAALFRAFLFREVQHELTDPVVAEIRETLDAQMTQMTEGYRQEVDTLRSLREAGVIRHYRHRHRALEAFSPSIDAETGDVVIIGSSLKGLLQLGENKPCSAAIKRKIEESPEKVRFLLTHPVVADLRANQEGRRPTDIGREIIGTLELLQSWGVPENNVRLYRGTPTCFGIKTSSRMLLNPYPYGSVAYDSPCFIVECCEDASGYIYDAFDQSHFRAWESNLAEHVTTYGTMVSELRSKLPEYARSVKQMFGGNSVVEDDIGVGAVAEQTDAAGTPSARR